MPDQYCPAFGPGSPVCPRSICDCFIDQFPDDMEQAGAIHPEFFEVMPPGPRCVHGYGPGDHHFESGWCPPVDQPPVTGTPW